MTLLEERPRILESVGASGGVYTVRCYAGVGAGRLVGLVWAQGCWCARGCVG
jgi:hypothetical protein